jgi:hypothetical protein
MGLGVSANTFGNTSPRIQKAEGDDRFLIMHFVCYDNALYIDLK